MPVRVPRYIKRIVFHEVSALARKRNLLTRKMIVSQLEQFGEFTAPVLLVHSSLSACGHIVGGAETVIEAIKDWIGPASLAMPVHTYCYPESSKPVFVEGIMPSRSGATTETFRLSGAALCSIHPSHSLACGGPLARVICEGHDQCGTPCGQGTPYYRLVEMDASVLYFGVNLDAATLFHTAEDAAGVPYIYNPDLCRTSVKYRDGTERTLEFRRHDLNINRRFANIAPWLEERGLLHRKAFGNGELLFTPSSRGQHQALVGELKRDPWFLTERR